MNTDVVSTVVNTIGISKFNQVGKNARCPKLHRIRSPTYDSGETGAMHCAQMGIRSIGTNMPLTKSKGRRTKLESIMIYEGLLAGGDATNTPSAENVNAPASTNLSSHRHLRKPSMCGSVGFQGFASTVFSIS